MNLKEFLTKSWPTKVGFYLGKHLPPPLGNALAGVAARLIVTLKPDVYWTTRDNLRHVIESTTSAKRPNARLHWLTYRVFFNAARHYYEMFHNMGEDKPDVTHLRPPVRVTPETERHIEKALATGRGLFIAACHTSNFDLGGVTFAHYLQTIGQTLHVLGLADPPPGFEFFNRLREKTGAHLTPISPLALREAIRRLQDGGVVLTGVDRPTGSGDAPVTFFGQTAYLPTGYIRMPLRTASMVMTLATFYEGNAYWIHTYPARPVVHTGDRKRDIEVNLRMVLDEVEAFIRRKPEQWMMFVPVWPSPPLQDLASSGSGEG